MRSRSLVLIMISLGCGAVAAVGMLQVLSQKGAPAETEEKSPVLVALADLDIKDELTPENVQIEFFPISLVPDGVVSTWEEAQGKRIMARVHRGMPIMAGMLFDKHQISDVVVPDGYKIIAMKVDKQDSFHGLLKAGDRVDVIGIRNDRGANTAKTFLKNVQVYAVDNKTDRIPDREDSPRSITTVQLVVNQAQAERLALFEQLGSIRFVMGSDINSNEPIMIDDVEVASNEQETPSPPAGFQTSSSGGSGLIKQAASGLWSMLEKTRDSQPKQHEQAAPKPVYQHVMTVMSSDGREITYEWADKRKSPNVQSPLDLAPASQTLPSASTQNQLNPNNDSNKGNEGPDTSTKVDYDEEDADY